MSAGKALVIIAGIALTGWVAYNYLRYERKAQETKQRQTMELERETKSIIADAVSGLQSLEYI